MERPSDNDSSLQPATRSKTPDGSPWTLPRLPVLIGIVGLGALVTTGGLIKKRADVRHHAEARAIVQEVASMEGDAAQYRERFRNVQWNADKVRAAIELTQSETLKPWMRERARYFDTLVGRLDLGAEEKSFRALSSEIRDLCSRGDVDGARGRLLRLPAIKFPTSAAFVRLQQTVFRQPLAELSRQNPAYYRAFEQLEPDAAKEDIARLRDELAKSDAQKITPQLMLKYELLSAVAPDDSVVADWGTLVTAADYFVEPDATTLHQWREAQKAIRANDWPTAVNRMQAITRTTVRTRQPFRAAYGRAILKNKPDDAATAYPFMQEAAKTGDSAARTWVALDDLANKRYGSAAAWLEAAVLAGEKQEIPQLLALYEKDRETAPRDTAREAGVLERIVSGPDAPPLASMLLARLFETGDGVPVSAPQAFAQYARAAANRYAPAWPEVARCYLRGDGTDPDLDKACEWATRAYASGERQKSVPILTELMLRSPDRTAAAVQQLLEHEQTAAPAGFEDTRISISAATKLPLALARYFDERGLFGPAAEFYAQSGSHDASIVNRHSELTTVHVCPTCRGAGKIQKLTACLTCDGKGTIVCVFCDGRGFSMVPGAPPCPTCGGTGGVDSDGRLVSCSVCGGTGKGKGSVIKQACTHCSGGRIRCRECTQGFIVVTKECPDCHGAGSRALADG
jgi:TPR repeat protein